MQRHGDEFSVIDGVRIRCARLASETTISVDIGGADGGAGWRAASEISFVRHWFTESSINLAA